MPELSVSLKAFAIRYIPRRQRERIRRFMWNVLGMQQGKAKPVDLSVLEHLKAAPLESLRNADFLRDQLLPAIGLNDEGFEQVPEELYPFCGRGLRCWQYPKQFSKYLVALGQLGVTSYLEIGVRHGGTFIFTVEYLRRFGAVEKALAMDLGECPALEAYRQLNPASEFFQLNSRSSESRVLIESRAPFDAALIDGDHSEEGCWHDFLLLRDKTSVLVFHDIVSDVVPGVPAVWRRIRREYAADYDFFEFTDQYESLMDRTGKRFLGLGMAVRKGFAAPLRSGSTS